MTRAGRKEISGRDGEKGTHDVFLVVCGSPVLGAPVADPQQQRPPARAHGVRSGEAGGEPVWWERGRYRVRGDGGGLSRGFWVRKLYVTRRYPGATGPAD
jgi:hypothetical protein